MELAAATKLTLNANAVPVKIAKTANALLKRKIKKLIPYSLKRSLIE
jgi:hypothetical protein